MALMLASFLGIGLTAALSIAAFRQFDEITANPAPRRDPGEASLYFDRPGVSAFLQAQLVKLSSDETEINYRVTFDSVASRQKIGYVLILAGDARTREPYPDGEPSAGANGCWASLYAIPDDGLRCDTAQLYRDGTDRSPIYRVPVQVISGQVDLSQWSDVQIRTSTPTSFMSRAGKRTYFALPAIGTRYTPPSSREAHSFKAGTTSDAYAPKNLDVSVDFGKLGDQYRLESVAPEPLPGMLAWVEVDAAKVGPRGSYVDMVAEDRGQRDLFVLGVFAGLAGAIVPLLSSQLWRGIRGLRRRRT